GRRRPPRARAARGRARDGDPHARVAVPPRPPRRAAGGRAMKERAQSCALLVLRLGFGLPLALHHGLNKALTFSEHAARFPDPLHVGHTTSLVLAIFGELVCGLAVAVGLFTRAAAVPAAFTMAVAFVLVHHGAWADGEMAFVYFMAFVAILVAGPGNLSLDAWIAKM